MAVESARLRIVGTRGAALRGLALALLAALLGACTGLQGEARSRWVEGMPPIRHFVSVYRSEPALQGEQSLQEYLQWVVSFYRGSTLFPRGWNDLVADQMAESGPGEEASRRRAQLYRLGRDMAAEWAKANGVRRVDTSDLAVWGQATERAIEEGNIDATLDRIEDDLRSLLAGTLDPATITASRYHPPDPEDWFAL